VAVVFTVSDLDQSIALYTHGFGLDLHVDDHHGDDPWTTGRHAATSWTDGAFVHFALYETKDGSTSTRAQARSGSPTWMSLIAGPSKLVLRSCTLPSPSRGVAPRDTPIQTATSSNSRKRTDCGTGRCRAQEVRRIRVPCFHAGEVRV
jgi:hypothetical protein